MTKPATLEALLEHWDSGDGKPYKGSLIDADAYRKNPDDLGCMCAQGQVLHILRGMTQLEIMAIEGQKRADEMVMETLGISRGQAILLRQVNDSQPGAPSIVLTHPEKVLGDNAKAVLAFFKYLDSMTDENWRDYFAARDAARAAAWDAAWDAARALVVRHLIGDKFTQAHYDLLTSPFRSIGITVHPEDNKETSW